MADRALIFGISPEILAAIRQVMAEYGEIQRVLVFGSRAKGTFRAGSDIDLAVFAPHMNSSQFTQLWLDLNDLPLVFKLDVLHWDVLANPHLKDKIVQEGRMLYSVESPSEDI